MQADGGSTGRRESDHSGERHGITGSVWTTNVLVAGVPICPRGPGSRGRRRHPHNVATIRAAARSVPRNDPATFDSPTGTAAIRQRHLQNAQPGPRRLHLHLDVPAIGHLPHVEPRQRVAADRAEGAHVAVAHAIQRAASRTRRAARPAPGASSSSRARARRACARRGRNHACHPGSAAPAYRSRSPRSAPSPSRNTTTRQAGSAAAAPAAQARP